MNFAVTIILKQSSEGDECKKMKTVQNEILFEGRLIESKNATIAEHSGSLCTNFYLSFF